MPDAAARPRVEREHAVGEEIVPVPRDAVEIERGRTRRGEDDAELLVDGHAGPRVRAARQFVGVLRPRVVAEFTRLRNRVEDPAQLAAVHVEGADVAGRSGKRLRHRAAHDQQIFEDDAGRAGAHAQRVRRLVEPLAQVDAAAGAERGDRRARPLVERPEKAPVAHEHAVPVHRDAPMPEPGSGRRTAARVELPDLASGLRVDRDHLQRRRRGIEHAVDDDRVALHLGALEGVVRVVGPGDLERRDVVPIDLRERGVADVVDAAVDRPRHIVPLQRRHGRAGQARKHENTEEASLHHMAFRFGDSERETVRLKPDTTGITIPPLR